ncbi:MAG: hypothetical protein K9L30_09520 [Desulfobacterales bacterium]|nr:hypothetical protein [Desulfobacterales bacterium]
MVNRKTCLVKDDELIDKVVNLMKYLKSDYVEHGLEECSSCQICLEKSDLVKDVHSQLKNLYGSLSNIISQLSSL